MATENHSVPHVDCTRKRAHWRRCCVVADEKYVMVVGTIATTHALPGRPVRLSREALEGAREQLLAGGIAFQVEHDSRRRIGPTFTDVEVRPGNDGEFSLVATMTMPESDYQRIGGRTAFSVAFPEMGVPGWPSPSQPLVVVMVDSYHWDDHAILEALGPFADAEFPVEGARYHQFAGEPPAKVVFDLLFNYKDIPPAVLAALMVESVKVLFRRRKKQPAERTETEVGELVPGEQTDDRPMEPVDLVAELTEPSARQPGSPVQGQGGTEGSIPAKVILEFRADARHASIECDSSESSERLIEKVIRALAEVTPIAAEQQDFPPSE
jgi:hypothetical protein